MYPLRVIGGLLLVASAQPAPAESVDGQRLVEAYVDAFNAQRVDDLAAMWAEDCRYVDLETGEQTNGRAAMREALNAAIAGAGAPPRLHATMEQTQRVTDQVVRITGRTTTITGAVAMESRYTAILRREGDRWLIATMEEAPLPTPPSPSDALSQLDWLVGEWVDDSDAQAPVASTIRWSPTQTFLIRSFSTGAGEQAESLGTQIIGWDPRSSQIRSWTFNADGSFGDGLWTKSDSSWMIRATQTLADGRAASGTYVLTPRGDDALEVKLIGLEVDGELKPQSPPVVAKRVAAEPIVEAGR